MRLKRIKLAGFKSFVDPTVIEFPSAMVGVAGPNGSGKSNIIDAVRWVMGESSAKHLRGGQIADVIFNGSTARQPAGSAMVEMVFDNSEGRLGGEYAQWNEISIRRSLDREGVSSYFLNGTRCRRKDITDVFLGTGLGPRSYAIIEQGTISRLVESKPEELRDYLEEAAGISRYKERRRETENRIRHTRENLERVDDLMEEVSKRLAHLRRQARAAERYKELKAEERKLRAELLSLRLRALDAELEGREELARQQNLAVEAEVTRERSVERDLTQARTEHEEAVDAANRVQQRYFELQTEMARLEEAIAGARRERALSEQRMAALGEQLEENARRAEEDARQAANLRNELESQSPQLEEAEARVKAARGKQETVEAEAQECRQADGEHRDRLAEARRILAVAEAESSAAVQRERSLRDRLARLTSERERLEEQALGSASASARAEVEALHERVRNAEAEFERSEAEVQEWRKRQREAGESLAEKRRELATGEGRLESLNELLRAENLEQGADAWLKEQGLSNARRLAAVLEIEQGWEWAVEVALGSVLSAITVDQLDSSRFEQLRQLAAGSLALAEVRGAGEPARPGTLAAKVRHAPAVVQDYLNAIHTSDDAATAWQRRQGLAAGESIMTSDGTWFGRNWVRVSRPQTDTQAGLISRERERESLQVRVQELQEAVSKASAAREQAEQGLHAAEQAHVQARGTARGAQEALAAGLATEAEAAGRERSAVERLEAINVESQEIQQTLETLGAESQERESSLVQARESLSGLEAERAEYEQRLEAVRQRVQAAREDTDATTRSRENLALRMESLRAQLTAGEQAANRLREERETLAGERERLQNQLNEADDPAESLQKELNSRLDAHRAVNEELAQARDKASTIEARVGELEHQRRAVAQRVTELRENLSNARLSAQEMKTRREGLVEQMAEIGADADTVLAEIEEEANVVEWEQRLEAVTGRIQRLGPINLAAIDECAAEAEREDYLKHQHADLCEALETLETAIHKIDRETRTRFKETFDHVNSRLKELFTRLFGGGRAALVLTGEELLDAGVVITAQPPGKKNATIQILSGGEKALVAVALVFAIFELNPAPFCLLDEVDAPMDDANIDRFCQLVKEMSQRIQFVLITHNRSTMGVCNQLIGVTMQEPGVSRLVGVDIDEAERLAVG